MKNEPEIKYPHSANLFRFCRRILDHKYGGIRVIDQDVGQILGFDPADCSHWKKGKKNIRSIQAMKSIAGQLEIDEKLVVDVAIGELNEQEAFHEFSGYSPFTTNPRLVEEAKKEFYRGNIGSWSKEKEFFFKKRFAADDKTIDAVVESIHEKMDFREPPLYLPEIVSNFPEISLRPSDAKELTNGTIHVDRTETQTSVQYQKGTEVKPFMRYRIAKALAVHFLEPKEPIEGMDQYLEHVEDVESSLFAAKLLTPVHLIKSELMKLSPSKDLVSQLADTFWVSKGFVNRRLTHILTND